MSSLNFDLHHVFQVGHLREASNKAHNAELKLFLEVQRVGAVHFYQLIPPYSPSPWIMSSILSNLTSDVCMDFVAASSLITNQLQVLMSYFSVCILEQDPAPVPPALKTKEDVLLFFKLYNPEKEELK